MVSSEPARRPQHHVRTRAVLKRLFAWALRIYFRRVEIVGAPSPDVGGRLFAANHANGLVDPVLIIANTAASMSPVGKSTLWKIPGLRWLLEIGDAVPVVRRRDEPGKSASENEAVFDRVAEHLGSGGNILIFPEGTSHNEPHMVPIRTGAARMLARARALGATGLTFQSAALEFEARDRFRSRALVFFGEIRRVDDYPADDLQVAAITETLQKDLEAHVVAGDSWAERQLIARVAELLAHVQGKHSLEAWHIVAHGVVAARRRLSGAAAERLVADVHEKVDIYYDVLAEAGITEDRVASGELVLGGERLIRGIVLTLLIPLALVGTMLYFVPYEMTRLGRLAAKGETDIVSTYKLGLGLLLFPLWAAALIAVACWRLPLFTALAATGLILVTPAAALTWLDRLEARRGWRAFLKLFSSGRAQLANVQASRKQALEAIDRARQAVETSAPPSAT